MPAQQPLDPNGKPSIYVPYDTGGGQGGYVFTDLAHLDSVITQWQAFHDGIEGDGQAIVDAAHVIVPPAEDDPSVKQATTAQDFLLTGANHNENMRAYAQSYLERLAATRAQYAADDDGNADRLRSVGPE